MKHYIFERMDLTALFTVLNLIAIMAFDKGPYIGIPVNTIGLIWDLRQKCHINQIVMRLALIIMNIYFLAAY